MPKGKKGKKGKGGKKGSSKKKLATIEGFPGLEVLGAEKPDGLLLALSSEGKKQSIGFYRQSYIEHKENVRQLRLRLHKVEHEQFGIMSGLMNTTDNMAFKVLDMNKARADFLASLDVEHDSKLMEQRAEIVALYEKIEVLEGTLLETSETVRGLEDYQETHGDTEADDELAQALKEAEEHKEMNKRQYAKIQTRHEQSLFFTSQRVQRIMKDMEAVAAQVELENLPSHSVDKMNRNRLLVHQIESTKQESEALENQIRRLEDINMDYITNSIEVDWNLMYGIEEYSDGDDYVFGLDSECDDLQQQDEDEWSPSDSEESDSANQLWDSIKPREQKYISRQPVDSIANLANQIIHLEIQKRITDPYMMSISGEEIQLKKANMVTAGPIKYYESQIKNSI